MDSQQKNPITEGSIYKQLLIFFFPILMGTFFQQLYNTVDAIIIGKFVGKVALGAVGGATGTIINLLVGFFTGLSSGATVIISQQSALRVPQLPYILLSLSRLPAGFSCQYSGFRSAARYFAQWTRRRIFILLPSHI